MFDTTRARRPAIFPRRVVPTWALWVVLAVALVGILIRSREMELAQPIEE